MKNRVLIIIVLLLSNLMITAQQSKYGHLINNDSLGCDSISKWTLHLQVSTVYQGHPAYSVPYSGVKSLSNIAEGALSITHTIFVGRKLWKQAAFYFDPEVTGGTGISSVMGMAGFPNGEIYRVGNPMPTPFVARAFIQQILPLGKTSYELNPSDINKLCGKMPASRLVISIGKFCLADFFDDNAYNHDARSQFLNWSIMAAGAWDFPADLRGYTEGGVIEWINPLWSIRFASVAVPKIANALPMEYSISKGKMAHSETLELERNWKIHRHHGAIRITGFLIFCRAPKYTDATSALLKGDSSLLYILSSQKENANFGGHKNGYDINAEQEIAPGIGAFARWSWNDGQYGSWSFTDIDRSLQFGITIKGNYWKRPVDLLGIAAVVNGISQAHIDYLRAGGYSFLIGDGKLNYGNECILEAFYRIQVSQNLFVSPDFQLVVNPAYNADRAGPVSIPGIRIHAAF